MIKEIENIKVVDQVNANRDTSLCAIEANKD